MVAENYLKIFRALPSKWHRCTVCSYMYISQLFDLMHFSILGAVFILHSPYFVVMLQRPKVGALMETLHTKDILQKWPAS